MLAEVLVVYWIYNTKLKEYAHLYSLLIIPPILLMILICLLFLHWAGKLNYTIKFGCCSSLFLLFSVNCMRFVVIFLSSANISLHYYCKFHSPLTHNFANYGITTCKSKGICVADSCVAVSYGILVFNSVHTTFLRIDF